jgi:hypothetical protein
MAEETRSYVSELAKIYALNEPRWSWDWSFNPNLKDHIHALGVVAANYNELEGSFYRLFYLTLGKFDAGKIIFAKLNNAERIEIALKVAEQETSPFREHYEHFISGYGIATENRNILLHSKAHNSWPLDVSVSHLVLAKPSKKDPSENNFITLDITELRSVADDLANFYMFGGALVYYRYAALTGGIITWENGLTATPPLPDKPAPPRRLVLSPQLAPTSTPPQPEPSGE